MKTLKTILQEVISGIKAWVDTNTVHKSGDETITGSKEFSPSAFLTLGAYRLIIKSSAMVRGTIPTSNQWTGVTYKDSNDNEISEIIHSFQKNGNSIYQINVWPNEENSVKNSVISYVYNSANSVNNLTVSSNFLPWNNTLNLGNSSSKWKTLNGINPGALSLPDLNKGADISSYLDITQSSINTYTPAVDGWISIKGRSGATTGIAIIQGDFAQSSYSLIDFNSTDKTTYCTLPVKANVQVTIWLKSVTSLDSAKFFPCLGNV